MNWLKPFLKKESNKIAKDSTNINDPQEEIIKRITKQMGEVVSEDFLKHNPLNLYSYGSMYYIADGEGVHFDLEFRKEDIIKVLKKNNNDIKKAFRVLLGKKPVIKRYVPKKKTPQELIIERISSEYGHIDKQVPLTLEKLSFDGGGRKIYNYG